MNKNDWLKIVLWVGMVFVLLVMFFDENPSQYLIEASGVAFTLAYAYGKLKEKLPVMVVSIILSLLYIIEPYSMIDASFWILVTILLI